MNDSHAVPKVILILNGIFFLCHEVVALKNQVFLEITQVCLDLPCVITATNENEGKMSPDFVINLVMRLTYWLTSYLISVI